MLLKQRPNMREKFQALVILETRMDIHDTCPTTFFFFFFLFFFFLPFILYLFIYLYFPLLTR